ncbi:hypothetical protein SPTER_32020 [Sporomusa termitida]|uniref:Uncharacterized protein n=2 Tax=Sporomusa termitida TaxID=2377 RepID=A0A517DWQ9_9FIRM|nr:hypothetical protein SPTER_32020 [Sporomusa termitida]
MTKLIVVISLISLSVVIAGCVKQAANESPTKSVSDTQNTAAIQPQADKIIATPQNGATTSAGTTINQEIFYGQWVIKKVLAYGPVGTYSQDDIKSIAGRKLSFSQEQASCFGDQLKYVDDIAINPVYKKTVVSASDFVTAYRLTLAALGITSDAISQIQAADAQGNGCIFFIKDNDTLILAGGGVFFELVRAR